MTTIATAAHPYQRARNWFSRGEAWLDDHGKGAWIAAMVLAFIVFWPAGLALLAYLIWSKSMFTKSCGARRIARFAQPNTRSSGNRAFDAYKADTLRRLEDEQLAFEAFLQRLREAKDKVAFDQFLQDRARTPQPEPDTAET